MFQFQHLARHLPTRFFCFEIKRVLAREMRKLLWGKGTDDEYWTYITNYLMGSVGLACGLLLLRFLLCLTTRVFTEHCYNIVTRLTRKGAMPT